MLRVKDADMTRDQLQMLVGKLMLMEYAYSYRELLNGGGTKEAGIITGFRFDLPNSWGPGTSRHQVQFRRRNGAGNLWILGPRYQTIYFTSAEEAT